MYDLRILVNGSPARKYHDREGKVWVEARKGSAFEVKVNNDNWGRVLAVVSVDGLNVIDGKHERPEKARGYIINSRSSITIPGWKINQGEVKEFYFTTNGGESYVRKVGADERNIGVIATAIFKEKNNWICVNYNIWPPYREIRHYYENDNSWWNPQYTTTTSDSTSDDMGPSTLYSAPHLTECNVRSVRAETTSFNSSEKVAVGSGERVDFKTNKVEFERDSLLEMITVYYDTYDGLRRRGIIDYNRGYREMPQAFPNGGGYCPDV